MSLTAGVNTVSKKKILNKSTAEVRQKLQNLCDLELNDRSSTFSQHTPNYVRD